MPVPTPYKGEKKDRFIGRCIAFLNAEGTDQDQAAGICYSQWKRGGKQSKLSKASKASVNRTPPPWWRHAIAMRKLLAEAWHTASAEWGNQVLSAIQANDVAGARALLDSVDELKTAMADTLGKKPLAIMKVAGKAAHAYWKKIESKKKGVDSTGNITPISKATPSPPESYTARLSRLSAEQIALFAEEYPGRILHPEIERLVALLESYETAREIEIAHIAERANRIIAADAYWHDLSTLQVNRLWQSDGVKYAEENQVARLQIVAILDEVTCPVCLVMHGQEVEVKGASKRIDKDLDITDPDAYVEAWKFPRFNEVQLLDASEITAAGYAPPFHPRCRCQMRWLG